VVLVSALLRDVLIIPERAGTEDYVLRLTDSVGPDAVARTLEEYVVTPALAEAFDDAMGLVSEAVTSGVSRGAFLSGSFGSGKSHFMAVLHALLRHEAAARGKRELQPVVARHDDVLLDRKVLPLAFHLLGAESMEQALFDGYLRQVRQLQPDAPLPALHRSDGILADAERQRARDGDERFFAELNGASGGGGDAWDAFLAPGGTSSPWTAESYAAARAAEPGSQPRQLLITRLAATYFTSYTQQAGYVDLDTGLAAMARHAKDLGFDAVVLFLDELVLWLAFSVQDREFFRRESQKLTKLVESASGARAIPLVSIVARQLDLRRWFADSGASGAEQEALDRAFRHQEGRFKTIVLGDDNLPYVARQRLLVRRDDAADGVLAEAFAKMDRRADVWDVLLDGINTDERHRGADEAAFRLTYPFSPALVSTLRHMASVMQRERTALKVMQQMLVDRRDTLTVADVVPVGDTFDYIVNGREALDSQAAALFRSATSLYREKLRPALLTKHGLREDDLPVDPGAQPAGFRTDDRLAKTLLLSAVAPKVPALKELTAGRLASLNHGSIVTPLPGTEVGVVLTKVREWSRTVPEIHVGPDPRNPVIRVQLSDVDYESVVERARAEDNEGRRRELVKDLVRDALNVTARDADVFGAYAHSVVWRGTRRAVDIVFGNVRDAGWLTEDHFRARPGTWRVVVDHPFDDAGHSAVEDLARLDRMAEGGLRSRTVVWLPWFLSEERMRDVRRLVVLQWLLGGTGERWTGHADHLSEVDRVQARAILESQRTALREGLRRSIQEAYGAAARTPGTLAEDAGHDRVLISLDQSFTPAAPVGATLEAAFGNLIDQAFSATFPGHPRFEPPTLQLTVRELAAVVAHVERAVAEPGGRVPLEGDVAAARRIANALGVGTAGETHFLFGDDRFATWGMAFERAMARDRLQPSDPVTVARMREWIEAIRPPLGLVPEVSDVVVLAWGALRQRAWYHHGSPVPVPRPGSVKPEMELRTEPPPDPDDWRKAVVRAGALFGMNANPYLTAPAVAELTEKVRNRAGQLGDAATGLVPRLEDAYRRLGLPTADPCGRLTTAREVAEFLAALRAAADRVRLVEVLARTRLVASDAAASTAISTALEVGTALSAYRWERLGPLQQAARAGVGDDVRAAAARDILAGLQQAVTADEITRRLRVALDASDDEIFTWLARAAPEPPNAGRGSDPVQSPPSGRIVRREGEPSEPVTTELAAFLDRHFDRTVAVEWRVQE
jgi:hypothetical protein